MTSKEFIFKTYNTKNEKWGRYGSDRRLASVMTDSKGVVYSYGTHYPLAFNVGGIDFVNNQGYSSTTGKHIGWAFSALSERGLKPVAVKLWRSEAYTISASHTTEDEKMQAIKDALYREQVKIIDEMNSKKRKDTQVYSCLQFELARVNATLEKVGA